MHVVREAFSTRKQEHHTEFPEKTEGFENETRTHAGIAEQHTHDHTFRD
jgi:hypothetical protein